MTDNRFTSGNVLIKNSFLNLAGMVIPLVIGVVAIPFAIRGLGQAGFGILSIAWVLLSYIVLLDLGLSRATTKFTSEKLHQNKPEDIASIMWTAAVLGLIFGVFGGAVLYLAAPRLVTSLLNIPLQYHADTIRSLQYISFSLPLLLVAISFKGMLGAAQRFDLVNAVQIPVNTLNFVFPALSFYLGFRLSTVMLLIVVFRVLASILYLYFCLRVFPACRMRPQAPGYQLLRKMLTFGGWVTVTSVVSPVLVYIDRFFIGSMLPIGMLTFYAAPLEGITRIRVIPTAVMNTLFPEFSRVAAEAPHERVVMLIKKSLNVILLTTGLFSIVLFFYTEDILTIWLGSEFAVRSGLIFKLFSASILLNFMALVPFTYLQGSGRPDLPAKCHLAELPIYIILIWVLINKFGITGAAIAWCLRVTIDAILLFSFTFRANPGLFRDYIQSGCKDIILLLASFSMALFLATHLITDVFLRISVGVIAAIGAAAVVYRIILSDQERLLLSSVFKKRPV